MNDKANLFKKIECELNVESPAMVYRACICFCYLSQSPVIHSKLGFLHAEERAYFNTLKFEKRQNSYLLGRFAAKNAIAGLGENKDLADILIRPGVFGQPVVTSVNPNIQTSISHCEKFGAGLAFSEMQPMGIDLEKMCPENNQVIKSQLTEKEEELLKTISGSDDVKFNLFWTAKESLTKILRCGLMTPLHLFEIEEMNCFDQFFAGHFKHFTQYKAISFVLGDYVCSMALPKTAEVKPDIKRFRKFFE